MLVCLFSLGWISAITYLPAANRLKVPFSLPASG
jgi:hypothetical protein